MTGLGVGPRVVDEMDGREIHDLMEYWADHPPPHVLLGQIRDGLGIKVTTRSRSSVSGVSIGGQATTPEQFAAMLGVKLGAS